MCLLPGTTQIFQYHPESRRAKCRQTGAFLSTCLCERVELKPGQWQLPYCLWQPVAWSGLVWPGLSPTTSATVNVPVSPIAIQERRWTWAVRRGGLHGEARGNPLCMNSPLSTLIQGKLPSKYSSEQSYSQLHHLSFVHCCTSVQTNKPHYADGKNKTTRHHTSDDNHIWTECKGNTIDFQTSYWAKKRGES